MDQEGSEAVRDGSFDPEEGGSEVLKIDVLTLFPGMFDAVAGHSMVKRAIEKGIVEFRAVNLRDFTHDRHKTCDDKPFGGGPGMLMKPEPVFEAADALYGGKTKAKGHRFVYLTPAGRKLDQALARDLSTARRLTLLCGHYEGVDQRVIDALVTDEISIGDYVLTGGELPAMVVIDAVVRLIPGVLGRAESKEFESFNGDLLEYPQYTRPAVYRGHGVPPVLLSGNHEEIRRWREKEARRLTAERRPDLLKAGEEEVKRRKKCIPKSRRLKRNS
jgi:tRNA (guanine37-N1)-methyltransferase